MWEGGRPEAEGVDDEDEAGSEGAERRHAAAVLVTLTADTGGCWWMHEGGEESTKLGRMPGTMATVDPSLWNALAPWIHSKGEWYFRATPPLLAFYCVKPQHVRQGQTFGTNGFHARRHNLVSWSDSATFNDPYVAALALAAASVDPRLRNCKRTLHGWLLSMRDSRKNVTRWLEDPAVRNGMRVASKEASRKCQASGSKAKLKATVSHADALGMARAAGCGLADVLRGMKDHDGDADAAGRALLLARPGGGAPEPVGGVA